MKSRLQKVLTEELTKNPELEGLLADEYQVSRSCVRGWASGPSNPHPLLSEMIIKFVEESKKAGNILCWGSQITCPTCGDCSCEVCHPDGPCDD